MTPPRTRVEKRREDRAVSRKQAEGSDADPGVARNRTWDGESSGAAGEGFSKGYGGSDGAGTGPSGPDSKTKQETRRDRRYRS